MTSKLLLSVALGLFVVLSGCDSTGSDTADTEASSPDSSAHADSGHDHSAHDHGDVDHGGKTDMEKMTEALANFSEEDRKSAMKQHFCPVTGEMLGTMGEPEKIEVQGQSVWICCEGCEDKLLAEPDKYLAKLDN